MMHDAAPEGLALGENFFDFLKAAAQGTEGRARGGGGGVGLDAFQQPVGIALQIDDWVLRGLDGGEVFPAAEAARRRGR